MDDERTPSDVRWVKLPKPPVWDVVRSYNQFVSWIEMNGLPKFVTFDHDLSFEHYPFGEQDPTHKIPYNSYKEKTGYHALNWLIEYCSQKDLALPEIQIHTMNIVGKENMKAAIKHYYERKDLD